MDTKDTSSGSYSFASMLGNFLIIKFTNVNTTLDYYGFMFDSSQTERYGTKISYLQDCKYVNIFHYNNENHTIVGYSKNGQSYVYDYWWDYTMLMVRQAISVGDTIDH